MKRTCVLILASMIFLGCDDDNKQPPRQPVPAPPAPDVTPKAGGGTGGGASSATGGGPAVASTAPSTTQTPAPPVVAPVPPAKDADPSTQAQDLIDQAIKALADNRLDDAAAALDKVDAMPDPLPKATREQAKTVRGTLEKTRTLQTPDASSPSSDTDNK